MTKIIDGTNGALGRIASLAAKEALKGEHVAVINCENIIITGSWKNIREKYESKRRKVGSGQLGPKVSRDIIKIVKRTVRGMLPNARLGGRGKEALGRVKCYKGVPKEFEGKKMILSEKNKVVKSISIKDISK